MDQERRTASIDNLFLSLGALKQSIDDAKQGIIDLNTKVGIQNGRIGKMELDNAFTKGMIRVLTFIVIAVAIPVCLELFKTWLARH